MVTLYMTIIIHYIYIYIYIYIYNTSFHQKLELLQYNACLAVTRAISGTSREKPGLDSLQQRHWLRKLSWFYKLFNSEHLYYLFKLIFWRSSSYITINICKIPFFKTRHTFLKNFFFPPTINEWNRFDHNIWKSTSFNIFRESILKSISPSANSFFNCHNPKRIRFTRRLRLGLSHLQEHEFKPISQDSLNPFCSCGLDIEPTVHYLLNCATYITEHLLPLAP